MKTTFVGRAAAARITRPCVLAVLAAAAGTASGQFRSITESDVIAPQLPRSSSFGVEIVALDDTTLAVTSAGLTIDSRFDPGVILHDLATNTQPVKFTRTLPAGGVAQDFFARRPNVYTNGRAFLNARYIDAPVATFTGGTYVYDMATGAQLFTILPADALGGFEIFAGIGPNVFGGFGSTDGNYYYTVHDSATGAEIDRFTLADYPQITDDFIFFHAVHDGDLLFSSLEPAGRVIHRIDGTTLAYERSFALPDPADTRRPRVSISGDLMLVVQTDNAQPVDSMPGIAYIYDATTDTVLQTLQPSISRIADFFGQTSNLNENYAVITSRLWSGDDPDTCHVFDVATGEEVAELSMSDLNESGVLNGGIALVGNTAYVGNAGSSAGGTNPPDRGGAVYAFDLDEITACRADTNADGMVAPNDFTAWIFAFNASGFACDQNGDRECTPADFNAWILNFNAGC